MTKTALVTGGNRGIGLAIADGLARRGISVLLGSRSLQSGESAAKKIPGKVKAVELNLSDSAEMDRQIKAILKDTPAIDILVNNAAILKHGGILEVSESDFYDSVRTNFLAPFDLCRHLLPGMIRRGYGRVVNLSSGWGAFAEGLGGPIAYAVSKAALNAMTVKIAQEMPQNVKVNAMCPGWVKTTMGGEGASRSPEEGAETALWLATLGESGPGGGFFRDKKQIEW